MNTLNLTVGQKVKFKAIVRMSWVGKNTRGMKRFPMLSEGVVVGMLTKRTGEVLGGKLQESARFDVYVVKQALLSEELCVLPEDINSPEGGEEQFEAQCRRLVDHLGLSEVLFFEDNDGDDQYEDDGCLHVTRHNLRAVFDVGFGQSLSPTRQNNWTRKVLKELGIKVTEEVKSRTFV